MFCLFLLSLLQSIGVGYTGGKKGHILGFISGPPSFFKNVILITKVKKKLKSVKNSVTMLHLLIETDEV